MVPSKAPKSLRVAFIYHGSSGIAGGYAAKFIEGLSRYATVHGFVNFSYQYSNENPNVRLHRIFFPITDRYITKKGYLRKFIRFAELLYGYLFTLLYLLIEKFDLCIYNPITDLRITDKFTSVAKFVTSRFAAVVHDAQSHFDVVEKFRDSVFLKADILIVHNEFSLNIIKKRLSPSAIEILIPFPWSTFKFPSTKPASNPNILFIGHVRPNKGVDFLFDAYQQYKNSNGRLGLVVAGSMSDHIYQRAVQFSDRVINTSLSDDDFLNEINAAHFVVMPYRPTYFNSSVHYCSIIHCSTPFICSDIDLFEMFEDGLDCIKFEYGNVHSFVSALAVAEGLSDNSRLRMANNALKKMQLNMSHFDLEVVKLFQLHSNSLE